MRHREEIAATGREAPAPKDANIDETDISILRALNEDARKSYRDVARELGIALTTVSNRVHRLEGAGVIKGYVPVLSTAKLGYELAVIVGVKIHPGRLLDVQNRIAKNPRVFAVYDVTGEWDSVVLARFRDRQELNDFIKEVGEIPHVERTTTQLVLNSVKEEKRVLL
ncbi:MAG: Lrp/AsnC family transcriptional regulator [Thermoplasmatota archaeon]